MRNLAPFLLFMLAAAGCGPTPRPHDRPPPDHDTVPRSNRTAHPADRAVPGGVDAGGVTVTIDVDRARFAPGAEVRISVMNRETLDAQRPGGGCMVGFSDAPVTIPCPSGFTCTSAPDRPNEVTICPPGAMKPVTPETFSFGLAEVGDSVTFTARSLVQGEPYEISMGGLAADGCNSVGANMKGSLEGTVLTFHPDRWVQTEMACP